MIDEDDLPERDREPERAPFDVGRLHKLQLAAALASATTKELTNQRYELIDDRTKLRIAIRQHEDSYASETPPHLLTQEAALSARIRDLEEALKGHAERTGGIVQLVRRCEEWAAPRLGQRAVRLPAEVATDQPGAPMHGPASWAASIARVTGGEHG